MQYLKSCVPERFMSKKHENEEVSRILTF